MTPNNQMTEGEALAVLRRLKDALPDVGLNGWMEGVHAVDVAITALTAAQQQGQVVAWLGSNPRTGVPVTCAYKPSPTVMREFNMRPLVYADAAPPSAPVGEADDDGPGPVQVPGWAWASVENFVTIADAFRQSAGPHIDAINEGGDAGEDEISEVFDGALNHVKRAVAALAQQPAQAAPGANTEFARIGDMSPTVALRVGTDSDCDVYLSVTGDPGEGVEFCTSGPGGGKSPRTREALVALMDAIRQDNIEDPRRDWWARRNIPTPPGDDAAGGRA